jgi:hypothetical protein
MHKALTLRVRIMTICARSTVRAWIGFPAARVFSSTTFHFSHNSSANPTTSCLSCSPRAYPRCPLQVHIFEDLPKQRPCNIQRRIYAPSSFGFNSTPLSTLSAKGKEAVAVESTSLRSRRISLNRILTSLMTCAALWQCVREGWVLVLVF